MAKFDFWDYSLSFTKCIVQPLILSQFGEHLTLSYFFKRYKKNMETGFATDQSAF